ncbi:MAG: hypothetical protein RL660_2219 [Bacteroidota bacterium]|jgi:hypothetical protein
MLPNTACYRIPMHTSCIEKLLLCATQREVGAGYIVVAGATNAAWLRTQSALVSYAC